MFPSICKPNNMFFQNAISRRKYASLPFVLLLLCIGACSTNKEAPSEGLIHIDVLQAFKEQKSMNLSDFVKEVEFVQLESSKDAYFMNARSFTVGEKYIMIADDGENRIILFDRNGNFIRHIGRKGKGPGEYNNPWQAAMDPDEEYIFIADGMIQKLIKYSVEGEFISEISTKDLALGRFMDEIRFISDDRFIILLRRPFREVDGFATMLMFDKDLNLVKKILPRANDENLVLHTHPNGDLGFGDSRVTFWEPYLDTLYTITKEGDAIPTHVVGMSKGGPSKEYAKTPTYGRDPNLEPENSIFSITEFGGYLHINGRSNGEWFGALYNHKSGDIFQLTSGTSCDTTGNFKIRGLTNDLYGIDPASLYVYSPKIDRVISWVRPEWIASSYDLDCIRDKKVKFPKLRDQFLEIAEDPEATGQLVLVLMKLK